MTFMLLSRLHENDQYAGLQETPGASASLSVSSTHSHAALDFLMTVPVQLPPPSVDTMATLSSSDSVFRQN